MLRDINDFPVEIPRADLPTDALPLQLQKDERIDERELWLKARDTVVSFAMSPKSEA